MSFARPHLIFLSFALPALIILALLAYARRRAFVARALGDPLLLRRLGAGDLHRFPRGRLVLLSIAAAALGFAVAGPSWGTSTTEEESSALNLVLALDISKSMLANDLEPNRLERERLFARRLVREMAGDRVGMVVFAGRAYVLAPLTVDHSALNLYLDALDPEMVSQGGSSIGAAITQATDLARGPEDAGGDRAVVLISDGEVTDGLEDARTAAQRAVQAGVKVFTVGVGTADGSPIPEHNLDTAQVDGYKRDPETGEVHISRMDESVLREIAEATGGKYVSLVRANSLDELMSSLRGLERSEVQAERGTAQRERFAIFVAIALLLLAIDAVWPRIVAARATRGTRMERELHPAQAREAVGVSGVNSTVRLALLILGLLAVTGFGIGDVERGNRHYRAGRYAEAVEAYQAAIRDGDTSPQVHYNLGTALLQLGRYREAQEQLQRALEGIDPELRQRAYYNLGNRYLSAARGDRSSRGQVELFDAAVEAYKRALRLQPSDPAAKWNLEMALREQKEQRKRNPPPSGQGQQQQNASQQQGQGGGGGGANQARASQQQNPSSGSAGQNAMSREQADRLLSAVEQDERDLTREKLRKGQRRSPVARDW